MSTVPCHWTGNGMCVVYTRAPFPDHSVYLFVLLCLHNPLRIATGCHWEGAMAFVLSWWVLASCFKCLVTRIITQRLWTPQAWLREFWEVATAELLEWVGLRARQQYCFEKERKVPTRLTSPHSETTQMGSSCFPLCLLWSRFNFWSCASSGWALRWQKRPLTLSWGEGGERRTLLSLAWCDLPLLSIAPLLLLSSIPTRYLGKKTQVVQGPVKYWWEANCFSLRRFQVSKREGSLATFGEQVRKKSSMAFEGSSRCLSRRHLFEN